MNPSINGVALLGESFGAETLPGYCGLSFQPTVSNTAANARPDDEFTGEAAPGVDRCGGDSTNAL